MGNSGLDVLIDLLEILGKGKKESIWKMMGIDERIHTEKGTLEYLFRNVLQYLQLDLAPRLQKACEICYISSVLRPLEVVSI